MSEVHEIVDSPHRLRQPRLRRAPAGLGKPQCIIKSVKRRVPNANALGSTGPAHVEVSVPYLRFLEAHDR